MCIYACMHLCMCQVTDAENIEAEALADGLVDKLIWQAVKAHMASQGQGPDSFILKQKSDRYFLRCSSYFLLKQTKVPTDVGLLFQQQK